MSKVPPERRGANGRATRLTVAAALVLVAGIAAVAWLAVRPGPRAGGAAGPRPGGVVALAPGEGEGEGGVMASVDPRRPGAAGQAAASGGGGGGAGADESAAWGGADGLAGRGQAGDDSGDGVGAGAEELLAAWDHLERQIAAAIERARESVVVLEYTSADSPRGDRRVASGVVISKSGEILSVRIDPPRAREKGASGTDGRQGDPSSAPIIARDHLGRAHLVQWLAADPYTGLTLLRVAPRVVRPIRAAADGPKLGSQVFVVGNPFGMGHSASRGHVAGLDRTLKLGQRQFGGMIQIQAPLYPGDSGAAVVDLRGDWLGLIRGRLAPRGSASGSHPGLSAVDAGVDERPAAPGGRAAASPRGDRDADDDGELGPSADRDNSFGFAIPTRDALWIADQLRVHGRVDRAYLGVHFVPERPVAAADAGASDLVPSPSQAAGVTPAQAAARSWRGPGGTADADAPAAPAADPDAVARADADGPASGEGVRLLDVVPDSPADRAGLLAGDRLVVVDGRPIRSRNDLIDRLDRIPARTPIVLGIIREDDRARPKFNVRVETSSRPSSRREVARATDLAEPRSTRASVAVTPTASRVDPPAAPPAPSPNRPEPSPAATSSPTAPAITAPGGEGGGSTGRSDGPATAPPSRPGPPSPTHPTADRALAAPPGVAAPPTLNDLKMNLPRAVVERIEHIERRLDQIEHFRAPIAAGAGNHGIEPARPPDSNTLSNRARATRP